MQVSASPEQQTASENQVIQNQILNQEYLHNYGIAYCLSKRAKYREEAQIAMGGYFQLGMQSVGQQQQVQSHIDQMLHQHLGGYKDQQMPAYMMRCLEILYTAEYQEFILKTLNDLE